MNPENKHTRKKYSVTNGYYSDEDFIKDCPNYDLIPTVLPAVKRLIAIGDIHGDLKLAIRSFKLANLIDDKFNWIADPPNTVVVQVGDQVDSCRPIKNEFECHEKKYPNDEANDMNIIDFFNDIHQKAKAVGGAVYSLLGNHELMNAQGNFNYVSYENYYHFRYSIGDKIYEGSTGRKEAFKPGNGISSMLACTRPSVLVVGSTMFVHAGILPVLARRLDYMNIDSNSKLEYLNAIVRKWLLKKLKSNNMTETDLKEYELDKKNSKLFLTDLNISPFWNRVFGQIPDHSDLESDLCFNSVKKTIEVFKIGQIVVGHTPQLFTNKDGINGTCYEKKNGDNKLYRVDGGFADAFRVFNNYSLVQVLEIIDDTKFNILTDDASNRYG